MFNDRVTIRLVGSYHFCLGCDRPCPMMGQPLPDRSTDLDAAIRTAAKRHYESLTEDSTPDQRVQCVIRHDRTRVVTFVRTQGAGMMDQHVVLLIHPQQPFIGPSRMQGLCPTRQDAENVARVLGTFRLSMAFSVAVIAPGRQVISNEYHDWRSDT